MKKDAQLMFSDGQTGIATSGTTASTNIIDTQNLQNQQNGINAMFIAGELDPVGTGAYPMAVAVQSCATSDGTYTTHETLSAALTAGNGKFKTRVPYGTLRFMKLDYTPGASTTVTPTVSAGIVPNIDTDYPKPIS